MNIIKVIEISALERDYWDKEVSRFENVHPFNAFGWGQVRAGDGWEPTYLIAKTGSVVTGAVMVLTKSLPLLGLSIMYAPRGPLFYPGDRETLEKLVKQIRILARKKHTIFFRIDPNISENIIPRGKDPFLDAGFIHLKNRWSMWNAPRDVYRTDLTKGQNEDQLFQLISPKARNGVRKSRKEGVIIRQANSIYEAVAFYNIFKKFVAEKGFLSRGFKYQKALWTEYVSVGKGALFLSVYKGEVVGGQVCLIIGPMCVEMHRGVFYKFHKMRINEALVWEGIKWAKQNGCMCYCQRGKASPQLSKFKEKFNAGVVPLLGYYDLVFYPLLYRLFYMAEFEILPRVWPVLMRIRKKLSKLIN